MSVDVPAVALTAANLVRLFLAIVLTTAAVGKLLDMRAWEAALTGYRLAILRHGGLRWSVPVLEFACAILVADVPSPAASVPAGALFGTFAIVLFLGYAHGARGRCGCFGTADMDEIGPLAIGRAIGLSILALSIAWLDSHGASANAPTLLAAMVVSSAALIASEMWTLARAPSG